MTRIHHKPNHIRVVLDRPERRNTITDTLLADLDRAVTEGEATSDCRTLVISAEGADFCAGMDLDASHADADDAELPYWTLLRRLTTSDLVTVAMIDATATAGGVGLAAACDVVLAGRRATFRLTETLFGLIPAMALPFVARRIGEQRAFTATLLAETLDARTAAETGLVDRLAPTAEEALRPLLIDLRRVRPDTVAALKAYRAKLFPWQPDLGDVARQAFLERLAEPGVRQAMSDLKAALTGSA
nr:enoyl-CoA hydratase-related protein [Halomonas piscis]